MYMRLCQHNTFSNEMIWNTKYVLQHDTRVYNCVFKTLEKWQNWFNVVPINIIAKSTTPEEAISKEIERDQIQKQKKILQVIKGHIQIEMKYKKKYKSKYEKSSFISLQRNCFVRRRMEVNNNTIGSLGWVNHYTKAS